MRFNLADGETPHSKGLSAYLIRKQPTTVQSGFTNHPTDDPARLAVVTRRKFLTSQLPLRITETFYKKVVGGNDKIIFCKMQNFSISPLALFPVHSNHFCCASTIDAEV